MYSEKILMGMYCSNFKNGKTSKGRLIVLKDVYTYDALQMHLLRSNYAYQDSITGGAFTHMFCFHINSECVAGQSLLSKDGKKMVTCELLPAP